MIQTFATVPVSQQVFYRRMKRYIAAHPPPELSSPAFELQNETTAGIDGKLKAVVYDKAPSSVPSGRQWAIRFEVSPVAVFHQREWHKINVVVEAKPEYDDYLSALLTQAEAWLKPN